MNNYTEFSLKQIDAAYINALVDLVNACRANNVEIDKVRHFQNGQHVTFKGRLHANAVCHDGSYGTPCPFWVEDGNERYKNNWSCRSGLWETIGFPWDYDDVSVHDAEELAFYLHALNDRDRVGYIPMPWEEEENEMD